MLRRKVKERNEYLKSKDSDKDPETKKKQLKEALRTNSKIPFELRDEAKDLLDEIIYDVKDNSIIYSPPKILVTTSHSPSSALKSFAKHISLVFNGSHLLRGAMSENELSNYCNNQSITHLIILKENKGNPSSFVLSKYPNGPTYYFSLFNVKYQRRTHSMGEKAYLVLDKMNSDLGNKLKLDLSLCFPKVEDANRLVGLINRNGTIAFRHYLIENRKLKSECEFDMKLYRVVNSTFDMNGEVDYTLKSFMNSSKRDVLYEEESS